MRFKLANTPLFIVASLLFGLKTYIVYRFMFTMNLENMMQELILFINPFVSACLFFGLAVWIDQKEKQLSFIRYAMLIGTIIIYFNLVFYRSFTDFITLPQLFQVSNLNDLGSSILTLIKIYDISLFLDVVLIWVLSKRMKESAVTYTRRAKAMTLTVTFMLLAGNFFLAEIERPQLLTRGFDREYLVKNIGLFNYHMYDIVLQSKVKTQRVFADGHELNDILNYVKTDVKQTSTSELFGVAKDRNVIFISAESLQSFVIQNTVHGEEITPFLNKLINDKSTFYFENFYHQTQQGKTSDSEFITENSLYPSSRGAVFFTHGQNRYHAIPEIIHEHGYTSAVFHANNRSFWNRDQMYDSLQFDYFYDKEVYDVNEDNAVGWGLKDKPFFEQSMNHLQTLDKPYYAKFITLTNHFPFELGEEDRSIEPYDSNSNTLNHYFPTVRYMDEAIEAFFDLLKRSGIYEQSIIVIMGDHDGISANHNRAMSMYLDKDDITPYDYIQLQRVPLFIHIPGLEDGRIMSEVGGQIDVKPTLLHLLGIDTAHDIYFGQDLFADERKGFIGLRNGDFISDEFVYTSGICFDRESGDEIARVSVDTEEETPCNPIAEQVELELSYSDAIIYGDLFRFVDFKQKHVKQSK